MTGYPSPQPDVGVVYVHGWDAVMLNHDMWASTYWHLWEHLERRLRMKFVGAENGIRHAMSYHRQEAA